MYFISFIIILTQGELIRVADNWWNGLQFAFCETDADYMFSLCYVMDVMIYKGKVRIYVRVCVFAICRLKKDK